MAAVSRNVGKISKPGSRFTAKRTLPEASRLSTIRHNERVGSVLFAYNAAHTSIFGVYFMVAIRDSHQAAKELWHSLPNDKSQREFAANYLKNNKAITKTLRNGILWAIAAIGELATFRNDAAHTEMMWQYDQLQPGIATKDAARVRLENLPFEKHWKSLQGDLSALAIYLMEMSMDVLLDRARPSCKRPRLQLAHSTSERTLTRRRLAKKATRELQRQSSREKSQP